jgi:predicted ferric reductase
MVLIAIVLITMSKRFLGFLRERTPLGKRSLILDEHKEVHKFTGIGIFIFSILHTLGHLAGSATSVSSMNNVEGNN